MLATELNGCGGIVVNLTLTVGVFMRKRAIVNTISVMYSILRFFITDINDTSSNNSNYIHMSQADWNSSQQYQIKKHLYVTVSKLFKKTRKNCYHNYKVNTTKSRTSKRIIKFFSSWIDVQGFVYILTVHLYIICYLIITMVQCRLVRCVIRVKWILMEHCGTCTGVDNGLWD